jgi:DNA-binding MarR family transcriptional regulator
MFGIEAMSKDQTGMPELTEEDSAKKARKAELKAAEKAKKAAKVAAKADKKAQRKLEKQNQKENAPETKSEGKKPKAEKAQTQNNISTTLGLGAKLQAVARLARSTLANGLLEHGLYAGQEQVLFLLDEHGPLALTELAEKLDVRAPTITKTVTRMEVQGFLSRATSRDDGRSIIIALTPDGRRVMKTGRQIVKESEASAFSSLNSKDRESLGKCLDVVLSNIKTR